MSSKRVDREDAELNAAKVAAVAQADTLTPADRYQELFVAVQAGRFSGEQWDQPNGWAPLQWMAIKGLADYGETALSLEIGRRWLATVGSFYRREHKLVEKYVLQPAPEGAHGGGGGEYPLQDGFGWTNGVTCRLLHDRMSG